jgi:pimeloyl-ACP methyl ester carboxylesterase
VAIDKVWQDATPDWTFGSSWPYAPHFCEHEGVRLHYVDEGAGEPVMMLHGNSTWSYVYRNFIASLSANRRCVVPDHMGFGRSDKPLDEGRYRLTSHVKNLTTLLLALDLRDTTLIMQGWGGPIGFGFATEHPERIKRLVILKPWAFLYPEGTKLHGLLELFCQPHVGEAMVQALNLFVEGCLPGGIYHKERLPELMPVYRAPFPDYNSRIGTLAFPRDIPVGDKHPSAPTMRGIEENL